MPLKADGFCRKRLWFLVEALDFEMKVFCLTEGVDEKHVDKNNVIRNRRLYRE
jgi:hypothetical protein